MRRGLVQRVTTELKTTQNGVLREVPTRIVGVPTGEEPRDEYHAGFVRGLLLKRV